MCISCAHLLDAMRDRSSYLADGWCVARNRRRVASICYVNRNAHTSSHMSHIWQANAFVGIVVRMDVCNNNSQSARRRVLAGTNDDRFESDRLIVICFIYCRVVSERHAYTRDTSHLSTHSQMMRMRCECILVVSFWIYAMHLMINARLTRELCCYRSREFVGNRMLVVGNGPWTLAWMFWNLEIVTNDESKRLSFPMLKWWHNTKLIDDNLISKNQHAIECRYVVV